MLLLNSRGHLSDSSLLWCYVLSQSLFFSAEYEAAMDRKFGLEPGTLFQGLKKVGWVTGTSTSYFVAIMQTLCLRSFCSPELLIWLQRFELMGIFIVNFSLFLSKEEEGLLSVSRSENHNQYFVSFLDLWPKSFSFVTSLNNFLFYCLALKAMITLDVSCNLFPLFPVTGQFG